MMDHHGQYMTAHRAFSIVIEMFNRLPLLRDREKWNEYSVKTIQLADTFFRFSKMIFPVAIKKQESGVPVKEISRELGINQATFYNWKAKYGGMEVSDVKKMKDMEAELSQYKKIVAELTFENRAIKAFLEKKS